MRRTRTADGNPAGIYIDTDTELECVKLEVAVGVYPDVKREYWYCPPEDALHLAMELIKHASQSFQASNDKLRQEIKDAL